MANTFLALPAPGGSIGPGAAVDVSAMGATKTITVVADSNTTTTVETSNQAGAPTNWSPVKTFDGSGEITVDIACRFMRLNVQELGASDPVANVGATDAGTTLVDLDTPVGNGPGVSFDVSALPGFKTIQICGQFGGTVNIEISLDGGTTWQTIASLSGGGGTQQVSLVKFAQFMRTNRNGVLAGDVSQPAVIVGGSGIGGGGGGGGGFSGTLTPGVVPYASAPTVLADSIMSFDGSKMLVDRALNPGFDALLQVGGGFGLTLYSPDLGATYIAFCQAFRIGAMLGGSTVFDIGINAGGTFDDLPAFGSILTAVPPVGGATITGFSQANGFENLSAAFIFLMNIGTGNLTLPREDVGSTDVNRFFLAAATLVLPPGGSAILFRGAQIPSLANQPRWVALGVNT